MDLYDRVLDDNLEELKDLANDVIGSESKELDPDEFAAETALLELRFENVMKILEALFFGGYDKIKAEYDAAFESLSKYEESRGYEGPKPGRFAIGDHAPTGPLALQTIANKRLQAVEARRQKLKKK